MELEVSGLSAHPLWRSWMGVAKGVCSHSGGFQFLDRGCTVLVTQVLAAVSAAKVDASTHPEFPIGSQLEPFW